MAQSPCSSASCQPEAGTSSVTTGPRPAVHVADTTADTLSARQGATIPGSPAAPLLRVRDLDVIFDSHRGPRQVLHQVGFDLAPGEILGVVGESGAGKSMTGLAITGLIESPGRVAAGSVTLAGERIDTLRGDALRRIRGKHIGMVFQDPLTSLNPVLSIGRHLVETIRTHLPVSEQEARERAIALLEEVEIPQAALRLNQYPHQFSGGMRQRVAIALALCAEPRLLIADEPTTALDVSVQAQVIRLLRRLCEQRQLSVLLITHDMGVIAETADRVMVMYGGRVLETGPVRQVLDHPQHPYTRALMAAIPRLDRRQHRLPVPETANWLEDGALPSGSEASETEGTDAGGETTRTLATGELARTAASHLPASGMARTHGPSLVSSADTGVRPMPESSEVLHASDVAGGQGTQEQGVAEDTFPSIPLLEVENLSRQFDLSSGWLVRMLARQPRKLLQAVDNVSFRVARGKTFGLVGESGSGKSTVARIIAGLLRPDAGRVVFDGVVRCGEGSREVPAETASGMRHRCQMIFQDPYASLNPRWPVMRLIAEPLDVLGIARDPAEREARVIDMLRHVRMSPDDLRKYPHEFSGGQRQRIAIARALVSQPDFIICDEPTSALDVSVQAQVLNLMRDLQDEYGLTYLLISHDMAVIRFMSDDIGVMQQGRLVEQGAAAGVLDDPQHEYTRRLMAAIPSLSPQSAWR